MRWNIWKCGSGDTFRFLHVCPIPKADGSACAQKHPAQVIFLLPNFPVESASSATVASHTKPRFTYFLDIFSGASSPVSVAVRALHAESIEVVNLIFGQDCDLLDDGVLHNILDLAASGLVGAALAAPYCSKHSMATLRPNGPPPVRTPEVLDGLDTNTVLQDLQVQESAAVHDRARHILTQVAAKGGIVVLENPLTSMTWLDGLMSAWVRAIAPYLKDRLYILPALYNLTQGVTQ